MSTTKEQITKIGEHLIRTKGYNGFSYSDISKELGIKNAAIHYHFPKKSDLGKAVIEINRNRFSVLKKAAAKENDPQKKLYLFFDLYKKSNENNMICFMGSLGSSFDSLPPIMKIELAEASKEIRGWISEILSEGKEKGQFKFQNSPKQMADAIISSLLASLILNKVTNEDVLGSVVTSITRNI